MIKGWLCLQKEHDQYVVAREGYGDRLGSSYSWDDLVPNARSIKPGDFIALWDSHELRGLSIVETIQTGELSKQRARCPDCNKTDVRKRSESAPQYRCGKCKFEFHEPRFQTVQVETFTAHYEAAWTPVSGIDATACRQLCTNPRSQQSIRPLDLERIAPLLSNIPRCSRGVIARRSAELQGGHRETVVRARVGQGNFRKRMLAIFDSTCVFSGPAPEMALEAAHLYRYADLGEHREDGGVLMRADLHALFDQGLITVTPESHLVEVHDEIRHYEHYARLHGKPLRVLLTEGHYAWLEIHWRQHR
jgi:ribosomal protein L37AE/L43A